ncbi:M12 family metallo-peptidase [Granulosicoccaceae sp. 1_MG-2023]|nr:M12 family metallo-peptidase [Granulosicoccaceae sp. 1_MG-2023]
MTKPLQLILTLTLLLLSLSIPAVHADDSVSATLSGDTESLSAPGNETIHITLSAQGTDYPLSLTPSAVTAALSDLPRQYFQGTVDGDETSWARLSWHEGTLSGHMMAFGQLLEISTADTDTDTKSRFALKQIKPQDLHGGNTLTLPTPATRSTLPLQTRATQSGVTDVLRIGIIVDSRFDSAYNGLGREQALDVINAVDGLYQAEFGLAVRIDTLDLLDSSNDPFIDISGNLETLLRSLRSYTSGRESVYGGLGVVHLFSGSYDDSNIIGLSWIDVACRDDFYNVSVSTPFSRQMLLAAHEIAHNLGARHDDDASCEVENDKIMWPNISSSTLSSFSDCTKEAVISKLSNSCHVANVDAGLSLQRVASDDSDAALMISVENNDTSRTLNGIVSQTVLPDSLLPAAIPDNCSFLGDTLACEHGSIEAGQSSSVIVELDGSLAGGLITASATPSSDADLYTLNNYASIDLSEANVVADDDASQQTETAGAESGSTGGGAGATLWLVPLLALSALRRREKRHH